MSSVPITTFEVDAKEEADGFRIRVRSDGNDRSYHVPTGTQQDFSKFFQELSRDFGTRAPDIFAPATERPAPTMRWQPLLTENVDPKILVGYGDPAVCKDGEDYWLVATSNDAPDAFPILHSTDLRH